VGHKLPGKHYLHPSIGPDLGSGFNADALIVFD
jgi:hypothetical protein